MHMENSGYSKTNKINDHCPSGIDNDFLESRKAAWQAGLPAHVGISLPDNVPTIIAVGGGKGGVGKSFISANIAAKLGDAGKKILLIDMDLGGSNLHTYIGLGRPARTLIDFVVYESLSFPEVITKTPNENVDLVAGGKDEMWSFDSGSTATGAMNGLWSAIMACKQELGYDIVILDLGAGNHMHTIDFFTAAHMGIVTVLPEPTSIENAYTFLKSTISRMIDSVGMQMEEFSAADQAKALIGAPVMGAQLQEGSYTQKLRSLHAQHPEFIEKVFLALSGRQLGFVVNQIRTHRDIDVGYSMQTICRDYFGFQTEFLGYLNYDEVAWKSLRNRRLMVNDFPHSVLAKRVSEISGMALEKLGY